MDAFTLDLENDELELAARALGDGREGLKNVQVPQRRLVVLGGGETQGEVEVAIDVIALGLGVFSTLTRLMVFQLNLAACAP